MRKLTLVALMATAMVLLLSGVAFAAHLGNGDRTIPGGYSAHSCSKCHAGATYRTMGPHGGYTATTNKCMACHAVHAAGNPSLLPGTTVTAVCQYCHDLTQTGFGPYYTGGGATVKSAHRVEGINMPNGFTNENGVVVSAGVVGSVYGTGVIPGANSTDGSSGNLDTTGQGGLSSATFTCNSCHTPHAIAGSTVTPYLGESPLKDRHSGVTLQGIYLTDRILKNRPNNIAEGDKVTEYGSAWCLACHKGRGDIETKHNHPVNETAKAYTFIDDVVWEPGRSEATVLAKAVPYLEIPADTATDPRSNKQYAMVQRNASTVDAVYTQGRLHADGYADFATAAAAGGPSCQQCHGNARDLLAGFDATYDGGTFLFANPKRFSFPHVSTNKALLVQENDKFCTSCHGISNLP